MPDVGVGVAESRSRTSCETFPVSANDTPPTATYDSAFLKACRREPVPHTPVWFMRQAGRSLPEYRAIRERHSFFEVAGTPELCAEVTLQPVRRHGVDAAVMFADIMTPVRGMGIGVELVEGVGPVLELSLIHI